MVLEDLLNLFYPRLCAGCQTALVRGEAVICLCCQADLPKTGFEKISDNPVAQLFWAELKFNSQPHFAASIKAESCSILCIS